MAESNSLCPYDAALQGHEYDPTSENSAKGPGLQHEQRHDCPMCYSAMIMERPVWRAHSYVSPNAGSHLIGPGVCEWWEALKNVSTIHGNEAWLQTEGISRCGVASCIAGTGSS